MSLTREMQQKIYESLNDANTQVKFLQDQVLLLDNEKSDWDNAISKVDGELFGEIQLVNRAIDDVKDAYSVRFTGVNSCRSNLFWMMTGINSSPTPKQLTFKAVELNENGYTDVVEAGGGNVLGVGVTFFHYLDPASGILTTSPTNAVTGAEQGVSPYPPYFTHDADTYRFGSEPKNYYGLKYYLYPYQKDIGVTFVTSFIGTVSPGSNLLTVMSPVGSTGQDPSISPIYNAGQIITCDKEGVFSSTTRIIGITTATADLAQIPTTGAAGVVTTNVSTVNIISVDPSAGLGVSAFDSISFSVLDNPTTGPVGGAFSDVTSNGEVYKASQKYHAVPSTSNLGGEGATFSVFTSPSGGIATVGIATTMGGIALDVIGNGGEGYSVGERITIAGTSIGMGAGTTANDVTFTLKNIREGRMRFGFHLHDDPSYWPKPENPQTVGIMQTANLGIGGRIVLDNSGDPKGAQGWDPQLLNYEIPMDLSNPRVLTKVVEPSVGADKSFWMVGFQTAPIFQSNRVSAGDPTGSIDSNALGALLETLSACDTSVDTPINNAIGVLTTKEASFNDQDGRNKTLLDAANALREERNELCNRIWGNRIGIGDLNKKITRYESLRGFINDEEVEEVIG